MTNKNYTLETIPKLEHTEPSKSADLEILLVQMAQDAEDEKKSEIPEDLYEKYKIFQGIRAALRSVIEDTEQEATLRLYLHNYLVDLPKSNAIMYLDNCRRTLKQLKKARTEQGIVFTETRQKEMQQIIEIIKQEKKHVILEGATGLGKTVLAEHAVKEYLKEVGKSESEGFIMINAGSATYEQLFGQIQIKKDESSNVAITTFVPGIIYVAAEQGLPVILEEYNTVKDARVLKGMQTLMSANSNTKITLERGVSINVSDGFTMILTGNPLSKGAEGMIGMQRDDAAISSRCARMVMDQLPANELLQQFLISESLVDDNLGVMLPEGVYYQIVKLMNLSAETYDIKKGNSVLNTKQCDTAGTHTQKIQSNLLSQRVISDILQNWKKNQYVDSIEDVILKVYLSESANVVEKDQELILLYTLFCLQGFFSDDKYPNLGDSQLSQKLKKLILEIDLSPIEKRRRSNIELTPASLVEGFNAIIKGALPKEREKEYTAFTKVFEDCFGNRPETVISLESGINLDTDKIKYIIGIFESIFADADTVQMFLNLIGESKVPNHPNVTIREFLIYIWKYDTNPNSLSTEELKQVNSILNDVEYSNDIDFESGEFAKVSEIEKGQIRLMSLFTSN